jgi:quercetin dioxygenase-like cupin family protein
MKRAAMFAVAAAGVAISTLWSATALATPTRGITSTPLTQSTLNGTDYIVRDITIAPGGATGWHWHDGELIGIVKQGILTHNASDCSVDGIYGVGQPIVEPAGADHVHIGRNLGSEPVILEVTYVDPVGKPLAEDAPNPGCGFD